MFEYYRSMTEGHEIAILGEEGAVLFVKASGHDLATIQPESRYSLHCWLTGSYQPGFCNKESPMDWNQSTMYGQRARFILNSVLLGVCEEWAVAGFRRTDRGQCRPCSVSHLG